MVLIQQDDLAIRLMRDATDDYALMAGWLRDERVLEFVEGRDNPFSLERIIEKYSPRTLGLEAVTPCFIVQDSVPIGYIQYYPIDPKTAREYEIPFGPAGEAGLSPDPHPVLGLPPDGPLRSGPHALGEAGQGCGPPAAGHRAGGPPYVEGIYGLDVFIGEPSAWNRGIGTRAVSLMCAYLFGALAARTITLDPEAWNTRAIRCYEKCGFRKIKLLPAHELHEGQYRDCWIMARQARPLSPSSPISMATCPRWKRSRATWPSSQSSASSSPETSSTGGRSRRRCWSA